MVLDHAELRNVLQTRFAEKKKRNAKFSLRSYAKSIGLGAAELSEFLRERRRLSDNRAKMIVNHLKLTSDEEERVVRRCTGILAGVPRLSNIELSQAQYATVSEWYHFAILSLAETIDFRGDARWIDQSDRFVRNHCRHPSCRYSPGFCRR